MKPELVVTHSLRVSDHQGVLPKAVCGMSGAVVAFGLGMSWAGLTPLRQRLPSRATFEEDLTMCYLIQNFGTKRDPKCRQSSETLRIQFQAAEVKRISQ